MARGGCGGGKLRGGGVGVGKLRRGGVGVGMPGGAVEQLRGVRGPRVVALLETQDRVREECAAPARGSEVQ